MQTPTRDSVHTMRQAWAGALANGRISEVEFDRRMADLDRRQDFETRMGLETADELEEEGVARAPRCCGTMRV